MPILERETIQGLKAAIYDLTEQGAKQALYGMVEILSEHPSILAKVFELIVDDARKYSNIKKVVYSK